MEDIIACGFFVNTTELEVSGVSIMILTVTTWKMPMLKMLIFLVGLMLGPAVWAQLVFDNPVQIFEAKPKQETVTATFSFKNAADYPVKITSVRTSCGCTSAKLKKKVYEPGEKGQIISTLGFGAVPGEVVKLIFVKTSDKEHKHKTYQLKIGAKVREYVVIKPRYVKWQHAAKPEPKTIDVKVVHDKPIRVTKVGSSNPAWQVELQSVKDGWEYRLTVTPPPDTTQHSRAALTLTTDFPKGDPLVFRATARVARKRKKPKTNWYLELFR